MTDADLLLLVKELQRTTPLGRLNLAECDAVFGRLKELGHDVTASTGLASGASEGTHPRYRAKANA